ncbi:unnamed protein product [Calypogeia fissa]
MFLVLAFPGAKEAALRTTCGSRTTTVQQQLVCVQRWSDLQRQLFSFADLRFQLRLFPFRCFLFSGLERGVGQVC